MWSHWDAVEGFSSGRGGGGSIFGDVVFLIDLKQWVPKSVWEPLRPEEQHGRTWKGRKMQEKWCCVAGIHNSWVGGGHGQPGGQMGKTDWGSLLDSCECWIERFVLLVLIPRRYLEAAPGILFSNEFQTTWLNTFYLYHISFFFFFVKRI